MLLRPAVVVIRRVVVALVLIVFVGVTAIAQTTPAWADGTSWEAVEASEANQWQSVAYGNGVWVAVAGSGTNRVMRSINDGESWDPVVLPVALEANNWQSVAYGNGVWVAVAGSGTNRVMRSTDDGASWSAVGASAAESHNWRSVAYANGVWVAVAQSGTNRVMRSTDDGASWSAVNVQANSWRSVAYGNGVWVAVANAAAGDGNQVMRSTTDGESWSTVNVAANKWVSVAYGNGVWVAVAQSGGSPRVMRSIDKGENWSAVEATEANNWSSVAYGNGVWVAVSSSGTNRVMRSINDGVNWGAVEAAEANQWLSVAYGNGVWVAVSYNGKVMRTPDAPASDSGDSGGSGGGTDPGIFLNVAGPVGESAPETPIYYGGSNLPGGSQYVLTLSDVCSPSRVIATLAEGTIGVQGSLSSFTRPPPRSPGTYNVRLVVTHSNGLAWQLQSQVTIGASGEYTIISAPVGSHSAAVASPPSSAGCATAVSSPGSASASTPTPTPTPAPVVDPVAPAGQCTTSGFGPYVQQADAKPEVLFPSGEKIQLAPGKTLGSSGGDLVNLDVELLEDNAVFEGHCYEVNVASTGMGGETVITLTSGELTGVTGSGFRPGTRVDIFLLSEPILLGSVVVYAEGDFSAQVSFIAGRIPSGSHTLQIQGVGYDGVVKIVNTGVWVENTPVVVPEGSVTWWWWLLIVALVIMFIIVFVRRWRNREAIY